MTRNNLFFYLLNEVILIFITLIIIITFKGFFKALFTKILGDDSAYDEGFVTLNPLEHIEFFNMTLILIIYFFVSYIFADFGPIEIPIFMMLTFCSRFINPIPLNESNFKYPKIFSIATATTGLVSGIILAVICMLLLKLISLGTIPACITISTIKILNTIASTSILWGILSMIPVPPLDGGLILRNILPRSVQIHLDWVEHYSFLILVVLFFVPPINYIFFSIIIGAQKKLLYLLAKLII